MMNKSQMSNYIDDIKNSLTCLSDNVWDYAETAFEEYKSVEIFKNLLESHGFSIQDKVADIDTAFVASYGTGKPVIGILAEYDALSGMSQKANSVTQEPAESKTKNGHGCGHNLLGAGSLGAALAVKEYLEKNNKPGTIKLFGCPGEEGGSGKAFMARDNVFDGLDVAFCWHPMSLNGVLDLSFLANYQILYKFKGVSAHAAASPHLGRSALDAVELMNVGVNFLREHVIQEARVHYAITNTGGFSPNVVQAQAEVLYLIRAPKTFQVEEIYQRINKIAQGAALMTETELEIDFVKACANVVPNKCLGRVLYDNFAVQNFPKYSDEELAFADAILKTCRRKVETDLSMILGGNKKDVAEYSKKLAGKSLCDVLLPFYDDESVEFILPGSSDVGDVSWLVPTAQISAASYSLCTAEHSWQLVSQAKSSIGHKGFILASKVIAGACIDVLENPEIAEKAKAELKRRLEDRPYKSAIPQNVKPRAISKL